jgi:biofilm protein TabA
MVLDLLDNASTYRGAHDSIDRALALLTAVSWPELEDGRHELAEGVFAVLSSYMTEVPESSRYEAHRRHADLQLLLSGRETIFWAPEQELEPDGEYDPEGDVLYFRESAAAGVLRLRPGLFALLYPADAHKPGRIWGAPQKVRKAVLKVLL